MNAHNSLLTSVFAVAMVLVLESCHSSKISSSPSSNDALLKVISKHDSVKLAQTKESIDDLCDHHRWKGDLLTIPQQSFALPTPSFSLDTVDLDVELSNLMDIKNQQYFHKKENFVLFSSGKSNLTLAEKYKVNEWASKINNLYSYANKLSDLGELSMKVVVIGLSSIDNYKGNKELSEVRAQVVYNLLKPKIDDDITLIYNGIGEDNQVHFLRNIENVYRTSALLSIARFEVNKEETEQAAYDSDSFE
ncbi:MAG: hypothetical protein AAF849_10425 [Bacteroidota bacterium]